MLTREHHNSFVLSADVFLLRKIEVWVQAVFIFLGMLAFVNQWDAECYTSTFSDSYSKERTLLHS